MQQDSNNFLAFSNADDDNQSSTDTNSHPYRSFKNQRNYQNNSKYRNRPGFGFSSQNQNNNFTPQNSNMSPIHRQGFQNYRKSRNNRGYQQHNNFQHRNKFTPNKKNVQEFSFELYYHPSMIEDPWKNCGQHNASPFGDIRPSAPVNSQDTTAVKSSDEEDKLPHAGRSASGNNDSD